jgi:hypothetical protein
MLKKVVPYKGCKIKKASLEHTVIYDTIQSF